MAKVIMDVPNRFKVEYDNGKFDEWCVYLTLPNVKKYAPRDTEYFQFFKELAKKYTSQKVYDDFVQVYDTTNKKLETNVIELIDKLSSYYCDQADEFNYWMIVVYAGMIAEQNKAYTKLGKRVKRLGIHQTLIEEVTPYIAANYSRGKGWRLIDKECTDRGF